MLDLFNEKQMYENVTRE